MNESIIGERFGRLVVVGYHHNLIDFESLTYSELITGGKENDKARG